MSKILLDGLTLPNGQYLENRFFKSAMSETMADRQQTPSDDLIALYDYWSEQDIGVLVTGNVMVDGRYLGEPGNVVLDSDAHLNRFQKWAAVGQKKVYQSGFNSIILGNRCIGQSIKYRLHLVLLRFQVIQLLPFVRQER